MPRVKFIQTTDRYAKGACVYLNDDESKAAEKAGHVVVIQEPDPLNDAATKGRHMKRIEFIKTFSPDKGRRFVAGERATLPAEEADVHLSAKRAKEFPVCTGNEIKDIQAPPQDKMLKRGQLVTK